MLVKTLMCLSGPELESVMRLGAVCAETDGAEAGLQTEKSINHFKDLRSWFLAYEQDELIGVLSVFAPMAREAEITGYVHPAYRSRDVFKDLYQAAEAEILPFGIQRVLFSINRKSVAGAGMMKKWKCGLCQTEYGMFLPQSALVDAAEGLVRIGRLSVESLDIMTKISADAFDESEEDAAAMLAGSLASTERELYGALCDGIPVGIVSIFFGDDTAMINGLAIAPEFQGKGFGKDFMLQLIQMLRARGLKIILDVNSANATAYALYKKVGFIENSIQDFYEKTLTPNSRQ